MRARLAAPLAALLVAAAVPAAAVPFAVQLGAERIALDAPPGFSDTAFLASPRMQDLAESLTSASNRILLFAITDADLRRFMIGDRPELRRYMIAVTPRGLERERVSTPQFATLVEDSLRDLGKPAGTLDYPSYLDGQPHGKASLLAELRKEPGVVSVLQGTRLPGQGGFMEKPQYLFSTTTLLLVRGKALQIAAYTGFDSQNDAEWLKFITQRWIDELLRLNSR
ncbi:MAG: hypothetical protein ACREUO_12730 [Burkholderiales bacterium]